METLTESLMHRCPNVPEAVIKALDDPADSAGRFYKIAPHMQTEVLSYMLLSGAHHEVHGVFLDEDDCGHHGIIMTRLLTYIHLNNANILFGD